MNVPTTKIRPIYNQIVVLRDETPVKIGLIVIPDTTRDRLQKESTSGVVLRLGPGRYRRKRIPHTLGAPDVSVGTCRRCGDERVALDGLCSKLIDTHERLPLNVRVGDRVWFHHLAGQSDLDRMIDIEENGRRLTVMWDDEVMALDGDVRDELELSAVFSQPGAQSAIAEALA